MTSRWQRRFPLQMGFHESGHLQDLHDRGRWHSDALVRDTIQPNDAWDLVHFLRTLQVHHHSKENDVLKAAGGKIPPLRGEAVGGAGNSAVERSCRRRQVETALKV